MAAANGYDMKGVEYCLQAEPDRPPHERHKRRQRQKIVAHNRQKGFGVELDAAP